MAYTVYPVVATGEYWSAVDNNTYQRLNINELWPYTTLGDIAYAASATGLSRLGIGAEKKVLTVVSGIPAWSTGAPGVFTTAGEILYASASNVMAVLPKGTDKQQLVIESNIPSWVNAVPGIFTTEGDLAYATGANGMDRLARGSNDDVLTAKSGVPSWETGLVTTLVTEVTHSTVFELPNGVTTAIPWDTETVDEGGWHDTVTNNSRITVDSDGRYMCDASVNYPTAGAARIAIYKDGAEWFNADMPSLFKYWRIEGAILNLVSGNYIEIKVTQSNGTIDVQPISFTLRKVK